MKACRSTMNTKADLTRAETTVLAETTGRLVPMLRGLSSMITPTKEGTLIERILPFAILFQSPDTWSMTEKTCVVELPDKEPERPSSGCGCQ